MTEELARLVRYGVVGAGNTLVTLVAFAVACGAGLPAAPAAALAFAAGALHGWCWSTRWTFAGSPERRLGRFATVQGLGASLSAAGIAVAQDAGLARLGAEVAVVPVVTVITYVLVRRFVFAAGAAHAGL